MKNTDSYYNSLDIFTNLLDTIFKFFPDGIVCKDSELKYLSVNQAYCNIFSINNAGALISSSYNQFLPPKVCKLVQDADSEIKSSLKPLSYVLNFEDMKILSVTSSPIIRENLFQGIISCIKDITQEENLKENFVNKHYDYLNTEKNLQLQRETFVASIGHDLKNPIIAQTRGLELLRKGKFGQLNPEQNEMLDMVLDSCKYMSGMLASFLATYRNYGGAIKLNFTEFSLADLVNECVSEMFYVAKDKSLEIKRNINYEGLIWADKVQIRRVIMNLISNAIKYAYKNTDIEITINSDFDNVRFEFENKSPYIPEDKQSKIFARYISYSGAYQESGVGLGLYSSKKIIESHAGKLYVKSFEDDRNIFGFKLPVKQTAVEIKKEVYLQYCN